MLRTKYEADTTDGTSTNLESFILGRWRELESAIRATNTAEEKTRLGKTVWKKKLDKLQNLRDLNKRLFYIVSGVDPDNTLVQ